LGEKGDLVIIMAFQNVEIESAPTFKPKIVIVDHHNKKLCS
jgi:aspartate 1-decarboxylase